MTNEDLIGLLEAGKVQEFNQFREKYPNFEIDLSYADLRDVNLEGANLNGADIRGADIRGARFDKQQIAMLPRLLCIRVLED